MPGCGPGLPGGGFFSSGPEGPSRYMGFGWSEEWATRSINDLKRQVSDLTEELQSLKRGMVRLNQKHKVKAENTGRIQ